jgi:hypothetical protein
MCEYFQIDVNAKADVRFANLGTSNLRLHGSSLLTYLLSNWDVSSSLLVQKGEDMKAESRMLYLRTKGGTIADRQFNCAKFHRLQ